MVVPGKEMEETKEEQEEECAASRSQFGGVFPCAGRPLPGEVLECLFAWLRSSDLSALYSSSSAAASPGKRGCVNYGRTVHCTYSADCSCLHIRSIHMQLEECARYFGSWGDTQFDTLGTCSSWFKFEVYLRMLSQAIRTRINTYSFDGFA